MACCAARASAGSTASSLARQVDPGRPSKAEPDERVVQALPAQGQTDGRGTHVVREGKHLGGSDQAVAVRIPLAVRVGDGGVVDVEVVVVEEQVGRGDGSRR